MSNIQDIEKLAQQTFSSFEADVPAEVWTNIQAALPVSPAVPSANTAGNAKTAGNVFSKINSAALWSTSIAVISIIAGWLYFSSTEEPKQETLLQDEITTPTTTQAPAPEQQINNQQSTINNSIPPQPQKENNTAVAADEKNTSHQTFSANDEVEQLNAKEEANKTSEPAATVSQQAEPAPQNTAAVTSDTKKEDAGAPDENNNETENSKPETGNPETETADAASLGFIPNVITPNSDNENDIFIIEGSGLKSLKVTIKDISGKTVHEWNGLHGFWDGRLENGSDAKPGVYFYNIFAISEKGKTLTTAKSFRLIR